MAILKIRDILYKISNKKVISYQLKEKKSTNNHYKCKANKNYYTILQYCNQKILEIKNFTYLYNV